MQQATARKWTREITPSKDFPNIGKPDEQARASGRLNAAATKGRKKLTSERPHPSCSDTPYGDEDSEFLKAVLDWRTRTGRTFPSNVELLGIVRGLGYVRVPHGYKLVDLGEGRAALHPEGVPTLDERPTLRVVSPDES